MGIGKRELMEDYYLDEIGLIFSAGSGGRQQDTQVNEEVTGESFFGF